MASTTCACCSRVSSGNIGSASTSAAAAIGFGKALIRVASDRRSTPGDGTARDSTRPCRCLRSVKCARDTIALGHAHHELVINVPAARRVSRQRDLLQPGGGEQLPIRLRIRLPCRVPARQVRQLHPQHRRLQRIEPEVAADLPVVIPLLRPVVAQPSELWRPVPRRASSPVRRRRTHRGSCSGRTRSSRRYRGRPPAVRHRSRRVPAPHPRSRRGRPRRPASAAAPCRRRARTGARG